jgi:hypothetical protein
MHDAKCSLSYKAIGRVLNSEGIKGRVLKHVTRFKQARRCLCNVAEAKAAACIHTGNTQGVLSSLRFAAHVRCAIVKNQKDSRGSCGFHRRHGFVSDGNKPTRYAYKTAAAQQRSSTAFKLCEREYPRARFEWSRRLQQGQSKTSRGLARTRLDSHISNRAAPALMR